MKRYFRIANDEYTYDGEYTSIEDVKNWLNANNLSNELVISMMLRKCHNWRIEEFQKMPYGGDILSITPFDFSIVGNIITFKFEETKTFKNI